MSKTPKKRKTRLKGTAKEKPCFDCGKTKNRFTDFKPRWAGCVQHRTPNGRRYFQKGCADCAALVNGNIRQPRCIDCDKLRPKKRKAAKAKAAAAKAATPTPVNVPEVLAAVEAATPEPVVVEPEPVVVEPEPEPVVVEPEPVVVEGQAEPSPESVKLPEPAPVVKPKPAPVATSAADILAMLDAGMEDSDGE